MRLIHTTTSLCRVCKNGVPARVVDRDGEVWMEKHCAQHGPQDVRIGTDVKWYEATRAVEPRLSPPSKFHKPVDEGCPFDCGPCDNHQATTRLPVVTVTSRCNLDCPICYVHNKNEDPFDMPVEDFRRVLDHLVEAHGDDLDIVNLTGGEPMLHPRFMELLEMSHAAGVHRVTICSNGIALAKDEDLVRKLADMGARVALSFDTFDEHTDRQMQGARLFELKMRCLELLERHDVDTTLIPVMTRGLNDHEIGRILELGFSMRNIRHIEVHTITYTGQSGVDFPREGRISMQEVLQCIEETSSGLLTIDDWVSSPCAHPLCYQIAYLLEDPSGGRPIPFTKLMDRATLYECLSDRLYLEPSDKLEAAMRAAIDRLWTEGDDRALSVIKGLLDEMFPSDRIISRQDALRAGERATKAVYIHSHMDEETFDTERLVQCCDSNCYPDGSSIPVCAYNVVYRETEEHFMLKPVQYAQRTGGQRKFGVLPIVT